MLNHNTNYQTCLSLPSMYLQFITPDVFQPRGAIFSGSMFGSALHDKMFHPKIVKFHY